MLGCFSQSFAMLLSVIAAAFGHGSWCFTLVYCTQGPYWFWSDFHYHRVSWLERTDLTEQTCFQKCNLQMPKQFHVFWSQVCPSLRHTDHVYLGSRYGCRGEHQVAQSWEWLRLWKMAWTSLVCSLPLPCDIWHSMDFHSKLPTNPNRWHFSMSNAVKVVKVSRDMFY